MGKIYSKLTTHLKKFLKNESGAGFIEYILLVSLIAIAALIAIQTFGIFMSEKYTTLESDINSNL